jgi:hypothetical protein
VESFSKLLRSHNCIWDDRETHPLKLMHIALNVRRGTMNEENPNEIPFGLGCVAGNCWFASIVLMFNCRRRVRIRGIFPGSFLPL